MGNIFPGGHWNQKPDQSKDILTNIYDSKSKIEFQKLYDKLVIDTHWSNEDVSTYLALLDYLRLKRKIFDQQDDRNSGSDLHSDSDKRHSGSDSGSDSDSDSDLDDNRKN